MKNIDNTIKYYELLMHYDDTSKYINYELPKGYHFELYKEGDEYDWVNIHISSEEFISVEEGLKYFHDFYDSFIDELNKRCIFIVDNKTGEKVGTATVSLLKKEEYGYNATIDWFAIKKEYQGKKLSRPLITKFISLANQLGHKKILLHTQTITWLAAKLYLDAGFEPLNRENEVGWKILKRLTNHSKLEGIKPASDTEMNDRRNIEIERQLNEIYGVGNYHYSVWDINGLHNVGVNYNGSVFEYEYYLEDGTVRLEELNTRKVLK